jgi:hypothetical protein
VAVSASIYVRQLLVALAWLFNHHWLAARAVYYDNKLACERASAAVFAHVRRVRVSGWDSTEHTVAGNHKTTDFQTGRQQFGVVLSGYCLLPLVACARPHTDLRRG